MIKIKILIVDDEIDFCLLMESYFTEKDYEVNGLGLAICKKIIEKHHGIIYAKGSNAGARFVLILPEIYNSIC